MKLKEVVYRIYPNSKLKEYLLHRKARLTKYYFAVSLDLETQKNPLDPTTVNYVVEQYLAIARGLTDKERGFDLTNAARLVKVTANRCAEEGRKYRQMHPDMFRYFRIDGTRFHIMENEELSTPTDKTYIFKHDKTLIRVRGPKVILPKQNKACTIYKEKGRWYLKLNWRKK